MIISRFLSGVLRSRLDAEPAAALTIPEGRRGDLIRTDLLAYFYATRFIAGTGIGGGYSAIDEMMPTRYRACTDIWIQCSYLIGSSAGTLPCFSSSTRSRRTPGGGRDSWPARCSKP